jgi:hypothetical protein
MRAGIRLLILLCFGVGNIASAATVASAPEMEVFVRPGCPFCEAAKGYLRELERRRPGLLVRVRDVSQDPEALQELLGLAHRWLKLLSGFLTLALGLILTLRPEWLAR